MLSDRALGNDRHILAIADPITGGLLAAVVIGALLSAAQYGLQQIFTPKPKPQQKGKLSGGAQLQGFEWGLPIFEVYGGDPGDGLGGVKIAGIVIDASEIRKVVTTSKEPVAGGGKGGGGHTQEVETTTYYQDLDIMVGRGPLEFYKIWEVTATGIKVIYDATTTYPVTGVIDDTFPPEDPYDHFAGLPDPGTPDTNPENRYSGSLLADGLGAYTGTIVGGGNSPIRIYEGNDTQLPDPLFQALRDAEFGSPAGSVAYRGRAHVVLENYNVSNGQPNLLFLVGHKTLKNVGPIVAARTARVGLLEADRDFTDLDDVPSRGFLIERRQAPGTDMELLSDVHHAGFFENVDGKVEGKILSDTIIATIDADLIGAREGDLTTEDAPPETVTITQQNETDLPQLNTVAFNDPNKNYDRNSRPGIRQITISENKETFDYPATMTALEGQALADRKIQEAWSKKNAFGFSTFSSYAYLQCLDRINIPVGDTLYPARIEEIGGSVPGVLQFKCTSAPILTSISTSVSEAAYVNQRANIPANTVATFIDIPRILTQQDVPGFMAALTPRDVNSGEWKASILFVEKEAGYERLAVFKEPATMGKAVGHLHGLSGYTPGDWFDSETLIVDLYGIQELQSFTEAEVLDGANAIVYGNELIAPTTCVRVDGFPNRWELSHMQRELKGTSSAHGDDERVVLLNSAVQFIKLDESERDVARTYKAVTSGQSLLDAAPVDFTWTAQTDVEMKDDALYLTLTGGTYTLSPAEALYRTIIVDGTLASDQTLLFPDDPIEWTVTDNTTGAFTLTLDVA